MTPNIFQAVNISSVQALLKTGNGALRFYAFGMAPQTVTYPYAVWQLVGGTPENFLDQVPDMDGSTVQVDVYAKTADSARAVAVALRDAIEQDAYVTFVRGEGRDPDTNNYTFGFDCDWLTPR